METDRYIYIVKNKKKESSDTYTVSLSLKDGTIPKFIPGQYINIFFPELNTPEGKAYSISSAPYENVFNITVKVIGEFSTRISKLGIGDEVEASMPYGFFYSEEECRGLVFIAGGIGITPCRSMVFTEKENKDIKIFHSIKKKEDAVFFDDFTGCDITYFLTREKTKDPKFIEGRIDIDIILKKATDLNNPEFFICGSISFVRDIWRTLKESGVSEDDIYTEAFFSH